MVFVRSELKQQAKDLMKNHFPQMFLVCLIGGLIAGEFFDVNFNVDTGSIQVSIAQTFDLTLDILEGGLLVIAFTLYVAGSLAFMAFVGSPFRQGMTAYFRNVTLGKANLEDLLHCFSGNYLHNVKVLFHRDLRIIGWSLLLIVPGIIKEYEYAFVGYLLKDHPDISPEDALELSSKMTNGLKWEMFVLDLSYFLWGILSSALAVFTLGLSHVVLNVYTKQTHAQLYQWVLTHHD